MRFDYIEWDEHNLDHATKRRAAPEIEQALWNAKHAAKHKTDPNRRLIRSVTNGGRRVIVIVQIIGDGVRTITGWDE